MLRRVERREHRREAGVAALEQFAPLRPRARLEDRGQAGLALAPACRVIEVEGVDAQAQTLQQDLTELQLDRRDRHVLAVGAAEHLVVRRPRIQQVGAARPGVHAAAEHAVQRGHQHRRAVNHRRIDNLPGTAALRVPQGREHAEREQQTAAAEVADQVQRRRRRRTGAADRMQRARQGDVVQVVPGGQRQRPGLPETGDAAVDQRGLLHQTRLGAKAEPLHCLRPKTLDQRITAGDEPARERDPFGGLQINRDRALAAVQQVVLRRPLDAQTAGREAVHTQHLGAEVGQQHAAHRAGPDTGELHHLHAAQRTLAHCLFS
jgi:hypothetical protein